MKQRRKYTAGHDGGERGQVLILAVVALVLVIIAVLLLFDVQTVIRGKVKSQNAVDAAAMTAAEWQKHSLNLIGELNLVRAAGTLISDPFLARGILDDPRSNAAEFFASLRQPIDPKEFTLFPEKKDFYNEDGTANVEKIVAELNRVGMQKAYLAAMDDLVSQLQTRISFVGPLIAFGAAQQAAKNNGVTYDRDAGEFYQYYLGLIGNSFNPDDASIYERITRTSVHGYPWRVPYYEMVRSIADLEEKTNGVTGETETVAYGISVGTKIKLARMPTLVGNPPTDLSNYLGQQSFYEMIHARNWCGLAHILRLDFSGNWWGDFDCDFEYDSTEQSEILPLHISFADRDTSPYDDAFEPDEGGKRKLALKNFDLADGDLFTETFNRTNPFYDPEIKRTPTETRRDNRHIDILNSYTISIPQEIRDSLIEDPESFLQTYYNEEDEDRRYDLLPELSWATFDSKWTAYDSEQKDWEEYLRGRFKEGLDYQSGAQAFFELQQDTVTITGTMGRNIGNSDGKSRHAPDIGQVFASSDTNGEARRVSGALRGMNSINRIVANAEAKPLGRIKCADGSYLRPFEAGRMILPVFTDTALIPIALEPVEGMSSTLDIAWIYYLTEFVPLLSGSPSIEESWERAVSMYPHHLHYFWYYVQALHMINDPAYRQEGLDWLDKPAVWGKDEEGNSYVLYNMYQHECLGLGKPRMPGNGGVGNRPGGSGINRGGGGVDSKGGPAKLH